MTKYADGTNLIVASKTVEKFQAKAEEFFDLVTCWYSTNRLIFNKEERNVLMFRTNQCKISKLLQINLSNNSLEINKNAKFSMNTLTGHIM